MPKKLGSANEIYIESLTTSGSSKGGGVFTFVNQYNLLTIDRIEVHNNSGYVGTSTLAITDVAAGNSIYSKSFTGTNTDISIDLSAYINKTITIDFSLHQYGCEVYAIRLK